MSSRTQQDAVYAAEHAALGGIGRRFKTAKEIQGFVDEVIGSDWFVSRWPQVGGIHVARMTSKRLAGVASQSTQTITIGYGNSATVDTVLHEMAHLLTPDEHHGPVFCHAFLILVREYMGFMAWAALEREYRVRGCLDGSLL